VLLLFLFPLVMDVITRCVTSRSDDSNRPRAPSFQNPTGKVGWKQHVSPVPGPEPYLCSRNGFHSVSSFRLWWQQNWTVINVVVKRKHKSYSSVVNSLHMEAGYPVLLQVSQPQLFRQRKSRPASSALASMQYSIWPRGGSQTQRNYWTPCLFNFVSMQVSRLLNENTSEIFHENWMTLQMTQHSFWKQKSFYKVSSPKEIRSFKKYILS
jgi:hypothetical protein